MSNTIRQSYFATVLFPNATATASSTWRKVSSELATRIHPAFGNPIFLSFITFYIGGSLKMANTSAKEEEKALQKWQ